jgi:hypothetical protein
VRRADNLTTFMCQMCRNSESLNILEPQGPVQAGNGIVLSLARKFIYLNLYFPLCFTVLHNMYLPSTQLFTTITIRSLQYVALRFDPRLGHLQA